MTKAEIWDRMRKRMGKKVVDEQQDLLEAQWEWAKQLGMVDEADPTTTPS